MQALDEMRASLVWGHRNSSPNEWNRRRNFCQLPTQEQALQGTISDGENLYRRKNLLSPSLPKEIRHRKLIFKEVWREKTSEMCASSNIWVFVCMHLWEGGGREYTGNVTGLVQVRILPSRWESYLPYSPMPITKSTSGMYVWWEFCRLYK